MSNNALVTLYAEHVGKVSDKWSIYFNEYDRILGPYQDLPIRLLEIGIQNGGSLEIWSKYFPHAEKLVGCDINPDCDGLSYDDPRISVVVGDANSDTTQEKILSHAPAFDVIIDDGAHRSSDIVKSFARYFPHLADEGVFIAEDLHCSYWENFGGGLFDPFSSITFFKYLADVVSHEHWGIAKNRTDILSGFFLRYGFQIDEETLQHIHSVEFINSMCIVRKAKPELNQRGTRVIVGSTGSVVPAHVLHSFEVKVPDQTKNEWTALSGSSGEVVHRHIKVLASRERQIVNLNEKLIERDAEISRLDLAALTCQAQIVNLSERVTLQNAHCARLERSIRDYQNSMSWRLSAPLRIIGHPIKRFLRVLAFPIRVLFNFNDLRRILINIVHLFKREGMAGIENRLKLIQSEQSARQMACTRGLSTEFLRGSIACANLFFLFKRWWLGKKILRRVARRVLGILQGRTKASRKLELGSLHFHIDRPRLGLINIVQDSYNLSGWAVDLDAGSMVKVRLVVGSTIHNVSAIQREDVQLKFGSGYKLPLDLGFAIALVPPKGVHRMRVEVEGPDRSWITVRRALFVRIPGTSKVRHTLPRLSYRAWARIVQKRLTAEVPDIKRHIEVMIHKPMFTIIVDTREKKIGLDDTLRSIRKQLYPFWNVRVLANATPVCLPDDVKVLSDLSLADVPGEFMVLMQSSQRLASNALYEFAAAINQRPDIDLVYGDEDSLAAWGRRSNPFHKPAWSPDYLETFNYIGFTACFRSAIARDCFCNAYVYDFVLRFTERTAKVLHIAKILGHSVGNTVLGDAVKMDIRALSTRLARTGRSGSVREHELHKGCYNIQLSLKRASLVSVVIPTAGKTVCVDERYIDLLTNIIGQIRDRSTYSPIEIIVIDNGDLSEKQVDMLAASGCRRITYSDPVFNIAKKLNLGVSIASGEMLLLLNDDIEILTPTWIERLLEHFEKPHVGVVGAKLLYPNQQTQHVGVVHNFGNPDHVRRRFPRDDPGYFFSTCGVRNYSAVTGACMMTTAAIYREVGGYSEELAVNFNDVDFCFKVRSKGLWVVYAPSVELTHMESLSRVVSLDKAELAWHHQRWAAELVSDQFYSERFLTIEPPTFAPCVNQRLL